MKKFLILILLLIVGFLATQLIWQPFPQLSPKLMNPTFTSLPTSQVDSEFMAWVAWWDQDKTPEYLAKTNSKLHTISPLWYRLTDNGEVVEIPDQRLKQQALDSATSAGVLVIPTIINDFDPIRVSKFLKEHSSDTQLDQLVNLAAENGFAGWDLDWEQIAAADKAAFTDFVTRFSQKLRQRQLQLSVTVHAQTGHLNQWEGTKGQDYQSLGKAADQIRIMAYDFHYDSSPPGPTTPFDALTKVINHAKQNIPTEKIVLGLPTYGYDWDPKKGKSLQYQEMVDQLASHSATTTRDKNSHTLKATYSDNGVKHEAWYSDYETMLKQVALANSMGITHFAFWRLGGEDTRFWQNLP